MMLVMDFDTRRRGRLISQVELNEYTRWLAVAVTEALHYFIGHDCFTPHDEARYLAVSAAHITHMLRDTYADMRAGYFNIPREVLEANHIGPQDVLSPALSPVGEEPGGAGPPGFPGGQALLQACPEPAPPPGRLCLHCRASSGCWTLSKAKTLPCALNTREKKHKQPG